MTRARPEWIGKTPDSAIPPRVRVRVFEAYGGVCHISGRKIAPGEPWDCDHIIALVNGGENRESNLAPALRDKHRAKTADDVKEKSSIASKKAAHIGAAIKGKGFPQAEKQLKASKPIEKLTLPRRLLYRPA